MWLRAVTVFQRLPELLKRLDRVEKKLAAQESGPNQSGGRE
jgi:UDP-3-O-[3-hydroxymyristoyl] glucosamine N-acyltransferase